MKKIGWIGLIISLMFVFAGCSSFGTEQAPSATASATASAVASVAGSSDEEAVEQTPAPPAAATPSSEALESSQGTESPTSETSPSPSAAPSPSAEPSAKPDKEPVPETPEADSITFSIVGNAEWGTVLAPAKVVLKEGDTAAGVLKREAKAHRLSYDIRGSGALTYVEGIDGLYEFDDGPTSGWKFRVNGKVPDVGAGSYPLKPGDRLEWFYASEDDAAEEEKESAS